MKKYIVIVCIALAVVYWYYDKAIDNCYTENFYLTNWPDTPKTRVPEDLHSLLSQPFTYLGKGRQFYVFESQDQKWVLKFIKCQRVNVSSWYKKIPLPSYFDDVRKKRLQAKCERTKRIFTSLELAQNVLSDLTGVVYSHLAIGDSSYLVTLYNPIGVASTLDINGVPFVLQKKADTVFSVLDKLYLENNREALANRLQQLVDLFFSLSERNIVDMDDGAFTRDNIGFLEDRAVYMDVGAFVRGDDAKRRLLQDIKRLQPVKDWIQTKDQTLLQGVF